MKKTLLIISAGLLFFLAVSCEEGPVSKLHEYTDAEIAFRDSLEAAKSNIKADLVIKTNVNLPADAKDYSGVEVKIDTTTLIAKLGLAKLKEITAALGTLNNGVQQGNSITFFAINVPTGADNKDAYTADGYGHWFDGSGTVCGWGDTDKIYSVVDPETFTFFIGQHPNRLAKDETYKIIQAVQKGSYRVAFVFNITVTASVTN